MYAHMNKTLLKVRHCPDLLLQQKAPLHHIKFGFVPAFGEVVAEVYK